MKARKITVCLLNDDSLRRVTVGIGVSQPKALEDAVYHYAALTDARPEVIRARLRSRIVQPIYFERGLDQ